MADETDDIIPVATAILMAVFVHYGEVKGKFPPDRAKSEVDGVQIIQDENTAWLFFDRPDGLVSAIRVTTEWESRFENPEFDDLPLIAMTEQEADAIINALEG